MSIWPYPIDWVATAAFAALILTALNLVLISGRGQSELTERWIADFRKLVAELITSLRRRNHSFWQFELAERNVSKAHRPEATNDYKKYVAQNECALGLVNSLRLHLDPTNQTHERFADLMRLGIDPLSDRDKSVSDPHEYKKIAGDAVAQLEMLGQAMIVSAFRRARWQRLGAFWLS